MFTTFTNATLWLAMLGGVQSRERFYDLALPLLEAEIERVQQLQRDMDRPEERERRRQELWRQMREVQERGQVLPQFIPPPKPMKP